ncbi:FRG domain-containing protein [bacterium]|nr:FRG domain-containing protein [FCB group bacterium]MBL7192208.1 FRG domain-containing protein [bacterium]
MTLKENRKEANGVIDIINYAKQFPESAIFRGENRIYDSLKPKIGRIFEDFCKKFQIDSENEIQDVFNKFENEIRDDFSRCSEPYIRDFGINIDDEVRILVVGQHYGLPTRLLDWTENILTAVYFAVEGTYPENRRIYIFNTNQEILSDVEVFSDKFSGVRKYLPPIVHGRIIAQSSIFTVSFEPYIDMHEQKNNNQDYWLREIIIPYQSVGNIRDDLNKLGVNGKSIWPDIDGIVKYINWFYLEKYSMNNK